MIGLIDYDSLIYQSVYKVVSIQEIKQFFAQQKSREWMEKEIVDRSINRLCNMGDGLMTEIERSNEFKENGFDISFCEYFITPRLSIRKHLFNEYKANRDVKINTMTKWANKVRKYLLDSNFATVKLGFEADDLIADRAKELGQSECIIISLDKDLLQIAGIHFNFYRKPSKEKDAFGNRIKNECKGLIIVNEKEAEYNFWLQMLTGDQTDNVKGIKGIGKVKAAKILESSDNFEQTVIDTYKNIYGETWLNEFEKNHLFLYLGTDRSYQTINMTG